MTTSADRPAAAPRRRLLGCTLAVLAAVLVMTGCSQQTRQAAPTPSSAAPSPPPASPRAPEPHPYTGVGTTPNRPVVMIKIDHARTARPFQRGFDTADLVYQQLVEAGVTRYLAFYTDGGKREVGPVRSFRPQDFELLRQHGSIIAGFSGMNPKLLKTFDAAVRRGELFDASEEYWRKVRKQPAYRRGERRPDAFNFFTTPARLSALYPKAGRPRDIGLRFGALPAGARPTQGATVPFSTSSTATIRWTGKSWQVRQDGRPMPGYKPQNVIVQSVAIKSTEFRDITGAPYPYSVSVGSGRAALYRDGKRIEGRWTRPTLTDGTRFVDARGKDLLLRPGKTMILLQPATQRFPAA